MVTVTSLTSRSKEAVRSFDCGEMADLSKLKDAVQLPVANPDGQLDSAVVFWG